MPDFLFLVVTNFGAMKKKWWIVIGVLAAAGLITGAVLYFMDWGNAESSVDKSETEKGDFAALSGTYVSNPSAKKSEILFDIDGPKSATGKFKDFTATLTIDESVESANLEVSIDPGSVFTDNDSRDSHLKKEDFFHVSKYAKIIFTSSAFEKIKDNKFKVIGQLEMMGIEKEFSFPFTYTGYGTYDNGSEFAAFEGGFNIDRTNYGMSEHTGVGDVAEVKFYVEMVKGEIEEEDTSSEEDDFFDDMDEQEEEKAPAVYEGDSLDAVFDKIEAEAAQR